MNYALYLMKVVHIFLDVCIWLFGEGCFGIGLWLIADGDDFKYFRRGMDVDYVYTASIILMVIGLIVIAWALMGCVAVANERRCLLAVYTVGIFITLVMELAVAGIVWANASNIKTWIKDQIEGKVKNYYSESENSRMMVDFMQYYLDCCGALSFRDYDNSKLPISCKNSVTGIASSYGCLELGEYFFERKAALFGGMALSLALFQIFLVVISFIIYGNIKRRRG